MERYSINVNYSIDIHGIKADTDEEAIDQIMIDFRDKHNIDLKYSEVTITSID